MLNQTTYPWVGQKSAGRRGEPELVADSAAPSSGDADLYVVLD